MKAKLMLTAILTTVCLVLSSAVCFAGNNDPRLDMREEDKFTPYSESIYFVRYTPWIKSMALVSPAEKEANIIGGDGDQQIRCLNISHADNNLVVMGSDTSGVWLTENGGEFWYNITGNMDRTNIADVLCHPTDKNVILAYSYAPKTGLSTPGIFRTENKGKSWKCVFPDYIASSSIDELFAFDSKGDIYAVTGKGVIKSTDGGKNWSVLLASNEENGDKNRGSAVSIDVTADGNTIVAAYSSTTGELSGINVSTDGGETWTKKYIDSSDSRFSVYSCNIDPKNAQRLIASGYSASAGKYYLYVSDDFGQKWTSFRTHSSDYTKLQSHNPITRVKFSDDYLYISFLNVSRGFRRLPLSAINLASITSLWEAIDLKTPGNTGFLAGENMYIPQGFDIVGDTVFACSTGPHKSTDGGDTWVRKSSGYNGALVNDLHMEKDGKMLVCLTDGNIAVSQGCYTTDNVPAFERRGRWGSSLSTNVLPDPDDENHLICWNGNSNRHKDNIGIIVSYDGGKTYKSSPDATEEDIYDAETNLYTNRITDPANLNTLVLEYDRDNKNIIYASCGISYDNGETWSAFPYYLMDICDSEPNKMVAWDIYGTNPTYRIMYSDNRGKSWVSLANGGTKLAGETEAFFDVEDSNKIWVKEQSAISIIDVRASKKTNITSKFAYGSFGKLVQNPKAPNHLLVSCEELRGENCPSLYESLDYGQSWHVVPGIFGMRTVRYIFFSETTDEVFLGSHNGIIVYEYEKFNYYIGTKLWYKDQIKYITLDLYRNYVYSPEKEFEIFNTKFRGWKYKEETYPTGEKIYIE